MRSTAALAVAVFLAAPAAFAQERGQATVENDLVNLKRMAELARVPLDKPVTGAPYSGDVVVSSSQTLADGNHIAHQDTSHVYRDTAGRTRREQSGNMTVVSPSQPIVSTKKTIISIVDPVAGYSYSLDTENKIAWRTPIGTGDRVMVQYNAASGEALAKLKAEKEQLAAAGGRSGGDAVAGSGAEVARIKLERGLAVVNLPPLEHSTVDGLAVEGRKTTETIPAGKIGNELPITITNEEWTSTDLKVLVLTKHSDPRTGDSTYHLTNVVRAEPDPSLFVVPPDYTVKDTGIRRNNE
jgi:hypothetical protein